MHDPIKKTKIRLIGIGPGGAEVETAARGCVAVVISTRHRSLAPEGIKVIPVTPLKSALNAIENALGYGDVAVLAGGDPLFFGIGRTLCRRFGKDRITVTPALSSMQIFCARLGVCWDDARFASLHGRTLDRVLPRLLRDGKTIICTDSVNTPAAISRAMLDRLNHCGCGNLAGKYRISVGENMAMAVERVTRASLAEIAEGRKKFAPLNLVLVENDLPLSGAAGLFPREEEIIHSRGLITKDEVRAASISLMDPPESGVMWDVGAGSGSVSLAAALIRPDLEVFAIERSEEQLANIRGNCRKFLTFNLVPVPGPAPDIFTGLPDPERIFIGGSGGRLAEIISRGHARLKPGGRMVVNAVLKETEKTTVKMMTELEMEPFSSRIAVSRGHERNNRTELNPITVITGIKQ